jgi:hypothetical protein
MLYYLQLLLLAPLYSLLSLLLWRDQDREILLLRQQLLILRRQLGRKPTYGRLEKLALLLVGLRLLRRRLATALLIVQPDTLLRWHRELVRRQDSATLQGLFKVLMKKKRRAASRWVTLLRAETTAEDPGGWQHRVQCHLPECQDGNPG